VLLFSATTKVLDGTIDSVESDLNYAKGCIDILEPCRSFEPVAQRYLNTLYPLYDQLRDMQRRMLGKAKTSIMSLLQPSDPNLLSPPVPLSKEEVSPVSEELSMLLMDPFGRKQSGGEGTGRRVLNADGSQLVFWWR
jgi:hypothetical protein